jgi:hypothetical protein
MGRKSKRRQRKTANRKRRQQKRRPTPRRILAREYYNLAFLAFHEELEERRLYSRAFSAKRRAFWDVVPPGVHKSAQAQELLRAYLQSISTDLRTRISAQSLAYWMHLYRRIGPEAIGENNHPKTIFATRATIEAAVQKWGKSSLCDRIALSDRVQPSQILRGYLQKHEPDTLAEVVAHPQLVLTDFGPAELVEFYETEKLAYEVWRSMAQLRIVGKGAELVVDHSEDPIVFDDRDDELDFLVSSFHDRSTPFEVTASGTVFKSASDSPRGAVIFLPTYNLAQIDFSELSPFFSGLRGEPTVVHGEGGPNFAFGAINMREFYAAHLAFRDAFFQKHGVSLESVLALVTAIGLSMKLSWPTNIKLLIRHMSRGYDGPSTVPAFRHHIEPYVSAAVEALQFNIKPEALDLDGAICFFSLSEPAKVDIDIAYAGPHAIFLPCTEDQVFVDYAYILRRLYHLFYGVSPPNQNFKGDALELITDGDTSVLPTTELKGADGTSKQIDAAFAADAETLVICECRAVGRSIGFDRGDASAIEKRRQVVESVLHDADDKARWLSSHPKGSNYDISTFRRILPIGVTPFSEFIHSRAAHFWISDRLPRVLMPSELKDALEEGMIAEAALTSCNTVMVGAVKA